MTPWGPLGLTLCLAACCIPGEMPPALAVNMVACCAASVSFCERFPPATKSNLTVTCRSMFFSFLSSHPIWKGRFAMCTHDNCFYHCLVFF